MARYDELGREIADQRPVELPLGVRRPPSMAEMIQAAVRREMSAAAAARGQETFEEADDFEVDEDPDPLSPYEIPVSPPEFVERKDADDVERPSEAVSEPVEPSKGSGDGGSTPAGEKGS